MEEADQADPFLWDVGRVVQELCTSNRSWKVPLAKKLLDPAKLERKFREHEVDGESLLTYEDEFGATMLWDLLDVKIAPQRISLSRIIKHLRRHSRGYQNWKQTQLVESQGDGGVDDGPSILPEPHNRAEVLDTEPEFLQPSPGEEPISVIPASTVQSTPPPETAQSGESSEPPPKKRRIAPTSIPAVPVHINSLIAPTKADAITYTVATVEELPQTTDSAPAYLGHFVLNPAEITMPPIPDGTEPEAIEWLEPYPPGRLLVGWAGSSGIPPGRRLQVARAMKRFLLSGLIVSQKSDSEVGEDAESLLPLLGESSDEGCYDSDTWREMEEEEELENLEARMLTSKNLNLSSVKVEEVIQTVILNLEADWVEIKKPKNDRKAWKLWRDAYPHSARLFIIDRAKEKLESLRLRIDNMVRGYLRDTWDDKRALEQQATGQLELSVFDRKYQEWLINMLQNPQPPPKPSMLPRLKPLPKKRRVSYDDGVEGEDILTSESDGLDEFVDEDVPLDPGLFTSDGMDLDSNYEPDINTNHEPIVDPIRGSSYSTPPRDYPIASFPPSLGNTALHQTPIAKSEHPLGPVSPLRAASEVIEIFSSPMGPTKLDQVPNLEDPASIGKVGFEYWVKTQDRNRLVVAVLYTWSSSRRRDVFDAVKDSDFRDVWNEHMEELVNNSLKARAATVSINIFKLFDCFISCKTIRLGSKSIRPTTIHRVKRDDNLFEPFCELLKRVIPHFSHPPTQTQTRIKLKGGSAEDSPDDSTHASGSSLSEDMPISSAKKRRRQHRPRDQNAENLRQTNMSQNKEFEKRRELLRQKLAIQGTVTGDKSRLIVNETKESDDQALIYINDAIGSKIKDHQIEGVRFMWNQIVVDSKVRQGCLLAHTMGLGKTMQVITLLVVIAEASCSQDPSVHTQIPESLRRSQTLILCPAGLVDNWIDEVLFWTPDDKFLGTFFKIDSSVKLENRKNMVRDWKDEGGVLITGYPLFTDLVKDPEIAAILYDFPNIVVCDEAHLLKNPEANRTQATAKFKTMSRIAMTGSPLTNNVMDYYSMINWVAPNYLADIAEFRDRFGNPIKEGLYADSEPFKKRKARKMLHVLKATVEPKVHRKDMQFLVKELPTKKEFILTLPLTEAQKKTYEAYLEVALENPRVAETIKSQAGVWSLVTTLSPLLAHPWIFRTYLNTRKSKQSRDNDDCLALPQDLLGQVLSTLPSRTLENIENSNKIFVLVKILDECKKIGDKVLLFSQSIPTLDYLETLFKRQKRGIQRLDGSTPIAERQAAIKKFNTDSTEIYLISTRAGGVGLNIYGANRVVIFDFRYTPAEEQQAIGRAYRIGQTKPVYVYWLQMGGTFENTIQNNAVFKTQLASRVVDKKNPDPWSTQIREYFVKPTIPEQRDLSNAMGQDTVLDALLSDSRFEGVIRQIDSTETFEKEETYELTAEEKREAEEDIELQRLRIQNPDEFKRREQEWLWRQREVPWLAPEFPGMGQVNPIGAQFQPRATPAKASSTPIKITVPTHLREQRDPAATAPASNPNISNSERRLSGVPSPESFLPILGTGTRFKQPQAQPQAPPENKPGSSSLELMLTKLLTVVAERISAQGRHTPLTPSNMVSEIANALDQNHIQGLPRLDKLQHLTKAAQNERIAEALLTKHLEPDAFVKMGIPEIDSTAALYDGMREDDFERTVWNSQVANPQVGNKFYESSQSLASN
ncbi:P-loop containing nucleoside triphosphate hydrolase protein [Lasiosphaeria miniovina]|uniref:P-loop containing nucleoside triphosphate hydrolase protein n=1 Tax=Lasiosphaeria miniovina TaxID=1954250 RepID=A0AA40AUU3_9PEZI|nr:P-loop containing nucleoside triphosphate hydrolase protein [Lasiosphaeria miniovina]KAK0722366.1 P-loop containing nucleoside triphosphate hydrolase protein [Lasiosphaeria miniovina]